MPNRPSIRPYTYGRQQIDDGDIEAVVDVLRSDRLTQGPAVEAFERALCAATGAPHAAAVANGTAALHLAGQALGWQPGDVVLTTPLTFAASANAVVYQGARPEFVDVDRATGCLDVRQVADRATSLRAAGKPIRAIVAVDYAGHPCDWDALGRIAAEHDLQLVDDACHALGATYRGRKIGAGDVADATCFSFHPVKAVTTAEGGAVVGSDPDLMATIKQLRTHGVTRDPDVLTRDDGPWYYEMQTLGFNYRLSDVHAALGTSQLNRLDTFVETRRSIASGYRDRLQNTPHLTLPAHADHVEHAYHLFPVRIDFPAAGLNRRDVFTRMAERDVLLQVHYIPLHLQPFYARRFGYAKGQFPEAEQWYNSEVSLPMYPGLNDTDLDYICEQLVDVLGAGAG